MVSFLSGESTNLLKMIVLAIVLMLVKSLLKGQGDTLRSFLKKALTSLPGLWDDFQKGLMLPNKTLNPTPLWLKKIISKAEIRIYQACAFLFILIWLAGLLKCCCILLQTQDSALVIKAVLWSVPWVICARYFRVEAERTKERLSIL